MNTTDLAFLFYRDINIFNVSDAALPTATELVQMTYQQKILAKIRAWIDRRLPRDLLVVTFVDVENGNVLFTANHMELILRIKMDDNVYQRFDRKMDVRFHTEHLSP